MTTLLWIAGLAAMSFAVWLLAAFVLRLRHTGRLVTTFLAPALVTGGCVWSRYWMDGNPGAEPGWEMVFLVVSAGAGTAAGLFVLPIWFLAEEKLGWRAR